MLEIIEVDRLHHKQVRKEADDKKAGIEVWKYASKKGLQVLIMSFDDAETFFSGVMDSRIIRERPDYDIQPLLKILDIIESEKKNWSPDEAKQLTLASYFYNKAIIGVETRKNFSVGDFPKEMCSCFLTENGIKKYTVLYPLSDSQMPYRNQVKLKAYIEKIVNQFSKDFSKREMQQFEKENEKMQKNSSENENKVKLRFNLYDIGN